MASTARLPSTRFDLSAFEQRMRPEVLRESFRGLWNIEPRCTTREPLVVVGQSWRLGDVAISRNVLGGFTQAGGRGSALEGYTLVRLFQTGRSVLFLGDDLRILDPRAVHIFDAKFEMHSLEQCEVCVLAFPSDLIGYDPCRHGSHLAFSIEQATGRVLASAMTSLLDVLPTTTIGEEAELSAMLIALFRGVLSVPPVDEEALMSYRAKRAQAMKSYAKERLNERDIGLDRLCREFNASRATVYRAFEADGGVDRFICAERLDRALRDLAYEQRDSGWVGRVARRWQFDDPSHFSRAFRNQHGCAPSDVPAKLETIREMKGEELQLQGGLSLPEFPSLFAPLRRVNSASSETSGQQSN